MDSHKGNEESKKISFTTGGSESNGNIAAKIFGAKRQAQVPHNKTLTAETIKSLHVFSMADFQYLEDFQPMRK